MRTNRKITRIEICPGRGGEWGNKPWVINNHFPIDRLRSFSIHWTFVNLVSDNPWPCYIRFWSLRWHRTITGPRNFTQNAISIWSRRWTGRSGQWIIGRWRKLNAESLRYRLSEKLFVFQMETEWQHYLRQCIDTIVSIAEGRPFQVFEQVVSVTHFILLLS